MRVIIATVAGGGYYYLDLATTRLHSSSPSDLFNDLQLLPNAHLCTGEEGK